MKASGLLRAGVVVALALALTGCALFALSLNDVRYDEPLGRAFSSLSAVAASAGLRGYSSLLAVSLITDLLLAAALLVVGTAAGIARSNGARAWLLLGASLGLFAILEVSREAKALAAMAFTAMPRDEFVWLRARQLTEPEAQLGFALIIAALAAGAVIGGRLRQSSSAVSSHLTSGSS